MESDRKPDTSIRGAGYIPHSSFFPTTDWLVKLMYQYSITSSLWVKHGGPEVRANIDGINVAVVDHFWVIAKVFYNSVSE